VCIPVRRIREPRLGVRFREQTDPIDRDRNTERLHRRRVGLVGRDERE